MDWTWLQLAIAALAAVLVPLILRSAFAKKHVRSEAAQTLRAYMQQGLSELDAAFQVAVDFLASQTNAKLSNEQRLTLYAFYKQALLGRCSSEKPSAVDMLGRAKHESWSALGDMPQDVAMQQYIGLVKELFPHFDATGEQHRRGPHPLADKIKGDGEEEDGMGNPMAGCVSMPAVDMSAPEWQVVEDVFHYASTGDVEKVEAALSRHGSVDAVDDEGRTMLHWAVDRSQTAVVELLLRHKASPNAQDADGMTPLHYAVSCEDEALTQLLVEHGALTDIADNDGETPLACAFTDELQAILATGKAQTAG